MQCLVELQIKYLTSVHESAFVSGLSLGLPMCSIWKIMGMMFKHVQYILSMRKRGKIQNGVLH